MPAARRQPAKATPAKKHELYFDQDRETKGTYRYKEANVDAGARPIMGSIWIRKDIADEMGLNGAVKVTIEVDTSE